MEGASDFTEEFRGQLFLAACGVPSGPIVVYQTGFVLDRTAIVVLDSPPRVADFIDNGATEAPFSDGCVPPAAPTTPMHEPRPALANALLSKPVAVLYPAQLKQIERLLEKGFALFVVEGYARLYTDFCMDRLSTLCSLTLDPCLGPLFETAAARLPTACKSRALQAYAHGLFDACEGIRRVLSTAFEPFLAQKQTLSQALVSCSEAFSAIDALYTLAYSLHKAALAKPQILKGGRLYNELVVRRGSFGGIHQAIADLVLTPVAREISESLCCFLKTGAVSDPFGEFFAVSSYQACHQAASDQQVERAAGSGDAGVMRTAAAASAGPVSSSSALPLVEATDDDLLSFPTNPYASPIGLSSCRGHAYVTSVAPGCQLHVQRFPSYLTEQSARLSVLVARINRLLADVARRAACFSDSEAARRTYQTVEGATLWGSRPLSASFSLTSSAPRSRDASWERLEVPGDGHRLHDESSPTGKTESIYESLSHHMSKAHSEIDSLCVYLECPAVSPVEVHHRLQLCLQRHSHLMWAVLLRNGILTDLRSLLFFALLRQADVASVFFEEARSLLSSSAKTLTVSRDLTLSLERALRRTVHGGFAPEDVMQYRQTVQRRLLLGGPLEGLEDSGPQEDWEGQEAKQTDELPRQRSEAKKGAGAALPLASVALSGLHLGSLSLRYVEPSAELEVHSTALPPTEQAGQTDFVFLNPERGVFSFRKGFVRETSKIYCPDANCMLRSLCFVYEPLPLNEILLTPNVLQSFSQIARFLYNIKYAENLLADTYLTLHSPHVADRMSHDMRVNWRRGKLAPAYTHLSSLGWQCVMHRKVRSVLANMAGMLRSFCLYVELSVLRPEIALLSSFATAPHQDLVTVTSALTAFLSRVQAKLFLRSEDVMCALQGVLNGVVRFCLLLEEAVTISRILGAEQGSSVSGRTYEMQCFERQFDLIMNLYESSRDTFEGLLSKYTIEG